MNRNDIALAVTVLVLSLWTAGSAAQTMASRRQQMSAAAELYERGMYDKAGDDFSEISRTGSDPKVDGYMTLCAIKMKSPGYESLVDGYLDRYPYSGMVPMVRFEYGKSLFDGGDYVGASEQFDHIKTDQLGRSLKAEFLFKSAYSHYAQGEYGRAKGRLKTVDEMDSPEYSAAARYALGYMSYDDKNFTEAIHWFGKSSTEPQYAVMSAYYITDCKYMLRDYRYVVEEGPKYLDDLSEEFRHHLSRIISESWLVLRNPQKAREYYDSNSETPKTRSEYFFAGSLMFAVKDWKGAIENYTKMEDRSDSLGQIANYNLGFSHIQNHDKISAMRCFKDASKSESDASIAEDAYFNYSKLAFDLNSDSAPFNDYLRRYPQKQSSDQIYSYIAVASLRNHDYAAAVEAFDKIDELNKDMQSNYMKTNYLRASQLISDNSYRKAIPCLKSAAYYADRTSPFWQLSRFWLAESYFRTGDYGNARTVYADLYNKSALDGMPEGSLIPYGMAYSYFKDGDYSNAAKWFDKYLKEGDGTFATEASLRKADCFFMSRQYSAAVSAYEDVADKSGDINEVYPYYQAGMCYGLLGDDALKIRTLLPVRDADPSARFYSEALYELGRAYVARNNYDSATDCFQELFSTSRDSTYMARSLIELGMISRNRGMYDRALDYYKQVVGSMPRTSYEDDALAAIESIYSAKGDPQGYLDYIASVGRSDIKTEAEKEQLVFNAAEQIFFSGDYEKALASLDAYLKRYPDGEKSVSARFYKAESFRNLGQMEAACEAYGAVAASGSTSFGEPALVSYSNIALGLQRYGDAYKGYESLLLGTRFEDNRFLAMQGMMRSAYYGRMFPEAVASAASVKGHSHCSTDQAREADWITAKSFLASSRREEALPLLASLSSSPKTEEGSEACYLLIKDCYDQGNFGDVEYKVYEFADSGTTSNYWLAKAFIVLGDSFVERGDKAQAKATYESIIDGYAASGDNDDVLDNVKLRLAKL